MPVYLLLAITAAVGDARNPLPPQIDRLIAAGHPEFAKLAAPQCGDEEFVRRVHLDLTGTIPAAAEVRAFLADRSPGKRTRLINQLLDSPGYVRRMVWFYDVTLMERRRDQKVPRADWEKYLRTVVTENRPYDAFVRELLSSDGSNPQTRPAAKFLLDRDLEPNLVTRDIGRVFLGRNLTCAQCHDHPTIDDYTQDEYYGIQAYLNRAYLFPNANDAKASIGEKAEGDVNFVSVFDKTKKQNTATPKIRGVKPVAEAKPEKGKEYKTAPTKDARGVPAVSRREWLATAITSRDNPAFARTVVNRVWAMMMGRGLVDAPDWDHPANPPSHPELLDLLTSEFVKHNYDVKWLAHQIALTEAYQRSSELTPELTELDLVPPDRYLVAILKPLAPEQLAYALAEAGGQNEADRGSMQKLGAKGAYAVDGSIDARNAPRLAQFRTVFGARPGEAEGFSATLDQTLFLKYNQAVRGLIAPRAAALARLADPDAVAEELFLSVLSRRPTAEEKKDVAAALNGAADRPAAMSELVWALVASAEFRFNH